MADKLSRHIGVSVFVLPLSLYQFHKPDFKKRDSGVTGKRQISLVILHISKNIDIDGVVTEFARQKGKRLDLCM